MKAKEFKMSFVKKILLISFSYGVFYYFNVLFHGATGGWHWNLFDYYGKVEFSIFTIGYFIFGLWLENTINRSGKLSFFK